MAIYGSFPASEQRRTEARKPSGRSILAGCAALIVVAMVALSRTTQQSVVELEGKKPQAWSYDWSGDSVPVPRTMVNYRAGTVDSVHGEFEQDARDKARPTQLAETSAKKGVWAFDYSGNSVPVPRTVVNYNAGTTYSPRSEFENSAIDKATPTQLAESSAKKGVWAFDYSGNSVPVPRTVVNYNAGTTYSPRSEFENSAIDKARPVQLATKKMHGMSAKDADEQLAKYFKSQAVVAAQKQAPPKFLAYSAKAADKDLAHYFKQQTKAAKQPQQQQLRMVQSSAT